MKALAIRFCAISPAADQLVEFLGLALGFDCVAKPLSDDPEAVTGGIFHAGDSRIEVWPEGEQMPAGVMLQIEVEDADQVAAHARANGVEPKGPVHADGEKVYYVLAPGGLALTFQSKLRSEA